MPSLRKLLLVLLLALVLGTVALALHHPPMRLMPPPLLFRGSGGLLDAAAPALVEDTRLGIFYGTSRWPAGPQDDRTYTIAPDDRLHVGTATLRIGAEGSTLDQLREWSTGTGSDRPYLHLERMAEAGSFRAAAAPPPEVTAWLAEIDASLAASRSRDLIVYVHGANTTVERAAGQAAMLHHFAGRDAVVLLFSWPNAENFLRYLRDMGTGYRAAPQLAELVTLLAQRTRAERIGVFTYSAGALVGSEALARLGRDRPEVAVRLGEIYHAAPDADFRSFVDDLSAYAPAARRVTAAVNLNDAALRLAAVMNRGSRAGRPDLRELGPEASAGLLAAAAAGQVEVLQMRPDTMPDLPATSHTFWYDDPWVSNDLLLALLFHLTPADRRLEPGEGASGGRYWTFPPDYPAQVEALRAPLAARLLPAP